jgi:hypothetical protein
VTHPYDSCLVWHPGEDGWERAFYAVCACGKIHPDVRGSYLVCPACFDRSAYCSDTDVPRDFPRNKGCFPARDLRRPIRETRQVKL